MRLRALKAAFPRTIPVMAGYLVLGTGFGILLQREGYHFGWAIFMSLFIYAGSMQYVTVSLLAGGASLVSAALMTLMVNARHLFYGISMIEKYENTGKLKNFLIFQLTDETYSLVCTGEAPEDVNSSWYYFFISSLNQFYWVLGSAFGGALGSLVSFDSTGIEFAMTSLFLVIFIEQWLSTKNHGAAFIGLGVSSLCLIVFKAGGFIIPSMIGITLILTIFRKKLDGEVDENVAI